MYKNRYSEWVTEQKKVASFFYQYGNVSDLHTFGY
jgi:hypothetical protein